MITDAGEDHQGIKNDWGKGYWGIGCSHDLKVLSHILLSHKEGKSTNIMVQADITLNK